MKKLLFIVGFFAVSSFAFASTDKYKVNDAAVDQLFAQSQDISSAVADEMTMASINQPAALQGSGSGQTVGGYLIRAFFCGGIALHRKYMGSDWGSLWWKYFCIPVVGGVAGCGDFWWVVFKGNSALSKYKGSDKFFVWL